MYKTLEEYRALCQRLKSQTPEDKLKLTRHLAKTDLFYLLTVIFGRTDAFRQWILDRCNEVSEDPNGHLDVWSRDHYKSSIITYALTIQDVLNDPEITVGIFSHSAKIAKDFLLQIKREFEDNALLHELFPDILYSNPHKDSQAWNSDRIIIKRSSNPKEATIEAHGIVDNQPTGKHFKLRIYDDVVTRDSVYTPDMMRKTNDAWALSLNLGMKGGIVRYIGTRYHFNDTYRIILERGAAKLRMHTATKDGTFIVNPDGTLESEPVLLTREDLLKKRREMGSSIFAAQMMQNPIADDNATFNRKDLNFYQIRGEKIKEFSHRMNIYLMVDGASTKNKDSDYTVMVVIGCSDDNNYYLLDMVRDRLNLSERCQKLFDLVKKWKPRKVGYEKNSREADLEYIREKQEELHYRFSITEIHTKLNKQDKITSALQPIFEDHRFFLPIELPYINHENKKVDLVEQFIEEEFVFYPFSVHDDMLDCMSMMIKCINHTFPLQKEEEDYNMHAERHHTLEYDPDTGEPKSMYG